MAAFAPMLAAWILSGLRAPGSEAATTFAWLSVLVLCPLLAATSALVAASTRAGFGGDGALRDHAEAWAARARAAGHGARVTGYTTNLWGTMKRAALVVSPSLFEGSPNVVLEAILAGEVVATDSFPVSGLTPKDPQWAELEISGVSFDALRLTALGGPGGPDDNAFLGSLDNVRIVPGPGAMAVLGLPAAGALWRRRPDKR